MSAQFNLPRALRPAEAADLLRSRSSGSRRDPGSNQCGIHRIRSRSRVRTGIRSSSSRDSRCPARGDLPSSAWIPISADYLRHDGHPARFAAGCSTCATHRDAPATVVVNETFARRFFRWTTIRLARASSRAGRKTRRRGARSSASCSDVKISRLSRRSDAAGLPAGGQVTGAGGGGCSSCARTATRRSARAIEAAIHEVDPNLPVFNIRTMDQVIGRGVGQQRLTMVLLIGFAGARAADGGGRRLRRDGILGVATDA